MVGEPTTRRFTVDEYYRMAETGILGEDDRVELLDGRIVQMTAIGPRHATSVGLLVEALQAVVRPGVTIRVQNPLRLGLYSELEPDVALVRGAPRDYALRHPGPEDVLLVVEVAETSQVYDRQIKIPAYARTGVPEVWFVDLPEERMYVFRGPGEDRYETVVELAASDQLTVEALPGIRIAVRQILP